VSNFIKLFSEQLTQLSAYCLKFSLGYTDRYLNYTNMFYETRTREEVTGSVLALLVTSILVLKLKGRLLEEEYSA
jgi:hypothetical protein